MALSPWFVPDVGLVRGDPATIRGAATNLLLVRSLLEAAATAAARVQQVVDGGAWHGVAHEAFVDAMASWPSEADVRHGQAVLERAATVLTTLAGQVEGLQDRLADLRTRLDAAMAVAEPDEDEVMAVLADAEDVHADHRRALDQAAGSFDEMDDQTRYAEPPPGLWERAGDALGGAIDWLGETLDPRNLGALAANAAFAPIAALRLLWPDGNGPARRPAGEGAVAGNLDPALVLLWFSQQDRAAVEAFARARPATVGNMDGAPVDVRILANRLHMEADLRALRAQPTSAERDRAIERLAALLGTVVDPRTGERVPRRFLVYDPTFAGGDGRIAEVFGDPTSAANVVTFVPGTGASLATSEDELGRARSIWTVANGPGREATAVIGWVAYDAPDSVPFAALARYAADGGPRLTDFLDGLPARAGQSTSIVAHSYGTTVTGSALLGGTRVDNVVTLGSPGMGVDSVGGFGLGIGTTQVYAMKAPGDIVGSLESFGEDPASPDFGSVRLATGTSTGHSSYWQGGSLDNIVAAVTNDDAALSVQRPSASDWATTWNDPAEDFLNGFVDESQTIVPLGPGQGVVDSLQRGANTVEGLLDALGRA